MTSVLDITDGPDPEWAERQLRKGLIAAKVAFSQITGDFVMEARTARELAARCAMAGDQFRSAATSYVPRFHSNPMGVLQAAVVADWVVSHMGEAFNVDAKPTGELTVTCPNCGAKTSGTVDQISSFIDEHRKGCPSAAEKSAATSGTHTDANGDTICHCGANMGQSDHCPECLCEAYEADCGRRPGDRLGESPEEDIEFVPGREPGREASSLLVTEVLRCTACTQVWDENISLGERSPVVFCPRCGASGLVPRSAERMLPVEAPEAQANSAESLREYLAHWLWGHGRVDGQGGLVLDQHAAHRWQDNQGLVAALCEKTGMNLDEMHSSLVRDVYIMEASR